MKRSLLFSQPWDADEYKRRASFNIYGKDEERLKKTFDTLTAKVGNLKSFDLDGGQEFHVFGGTDGLVVRLEFPAEFEKASGTFRVVVRKTEHGWALEWINVNSDALQ